MVVVVVVDSSGSSGGHFQVDIQISTIYKHNFD